MWSREPEQNQNQSEHHTPLGPLGRHRDPEQVQTPGRWCSSSMTRSLRLWTHLTELSAPDAMTQPAGFLIGWLQPLTDWRRIICVSLCFSPDRPLSSGCPQAVLTLQWESEKDSETQRLRDTETQRLRDSETQRHRDTETQRLRDTETQRLRDTETQRHGDSETQRHRDSETQRLRDTETQRLRDTETQRHRDSETQRHRDSETQRLRDTETQRLRDSETQRHRDSETKTQFHTQSATSSDEAISCE
ncbi:unnamed protein product [Pleuronectes platessa]|uniref:Uncharacterized protein n=1 Tax=Pleuronectes platessa TaxID=8262 RepID=A0A9N7Z8Z8_PLEPL|nr:unnamed protein product [Pleuronectes platessa]